MLEIVNQFLYIPDVSVVFLCRLYSSCCSCKFFLFQISSHYLLWN